MKRKIHFELTVGSYWESEEIPRNIFSSLKLPVGGIPTEKIIEFETDNCRPFDDACDELKKVMGNKEYHIWYWTWLN